MGLKYVNLVYLMLTMSWSGITFTVLLADVKHFLYSKCVWKFNFVLCDKFLGIEGAYRYTASIVLFYIFMSLATINCNSTVAAWIHQECWILKCILFLATCIFGYLLPFSRLMMEILYNTFLCGSILFIVAMFVLFVDFAHSLRLYWIRQARENMDIPTCYLCTWLFVVHLLTSLLYAISLDILLAFIFFNKIDDCINTLIYASVNICLCLFCFGTSYFPTLRDRQSSSQIVFASVLFIVTYSTWLAVSDPENEFCNMYGTIFTGSILESSSSFRSLVSMVILVPPLLFLCFKEETPSYIRSLICSDSAEETWYMYSSFHLVMAGASSFVLMSVTNYYEPVYTVFNPFYDTSRPLRASVIYFEGYNWHRYLLLCIVSTFIPAFYLLLLLSRIVSDYFVKSKSRKENSDKRGKASKSIMSDKSEFLCIPVTKKEANEMLRKNMDSNILEPVEKSIRYLLLQCFYVTDIQISFWHFPKNISQTYFNGRNGSNACTIIAMIIGRFFSRSDIPYQDIGYLCDTWLNLFYASIQEGNSLYDMLVKDLGVLDLSIDEVTERIGNKLNVVQILTPLAVSFESDVETATIYYQLEQLMSLKQKQVVLFIHKRRTSAFLIYENSNVVYTDSHAFGENGALIIASNKSNLMNLVIFLKDVLGSNDNKLASLTPVVYEERHIYSEIK